MLPRLLLSVIMVLSFVLGAAQTVSADNRLNEGFTYKSADFNCTYGRTDLIHDTTAYHGWARVISKIVLDNPTTGKIICGDFSPVPGGYMRLKIQYLKWNGSIWGFCGETPTYYNNVNASEFNLTEGNHPNGSAPCGAGSYSVQGVGAVLVNGTWYGGPIQTLPGHNLP
jgi:hypothetical protein